jgi:hypothetical protein
MTSFPLNTAPANGGMLFRLRKAFPQALEETVDAVLSVIPAGDYPPSNNDIGPVTIRGEKLYIPYRIYSPEPSSPPACTNEMETLKACIYTRHYSGLVREKYLGQVVQSREIWVMSYIIQLAGEYVVEIVQNLVANAETLRHDALLQFADENPHFVDLVQQRIISYWSCYYRYRFPNFKDYPGFQFMKTIGLWNASNARRLLAQ